MEEFLVFSVIVAIYLSGFLYLFFDISSGYKYFSVSVQENIVLWNKNDWNVLYENSTIWMNERNVKIFTLKVFSFMNEYYYSLTNDDNKHWNTDRQTLLLFFGRNKNSFTTVYSFFLLFKISSNNEWAIERKVMDWLNENRSNRKENGIKKFSFSNGKMTRLFKEKKQNFWRL